MEATERGLKENKLFYTQRANGIMGLAPALPTYDQPSVLSPGKLRKPEVLQGHSRSELNGV